MSKLFKVRRVIGMYAEADRIPRLSLEPRTLGQIIDRALKISPVLFSRLFIWMLLASVLSVSSNIAPFSQSVSAIIALSLVSGLIGFLIYFYLCFMASEMLLGNSSVRPSDVSSRVSFRIIGKLILLGLTVGCATLLWSLLFIIPGIVYWVNRILAGYALLLDNCSIDESLKKSKMLMTQERWYKASSPVMRVLGISLIVVVFNILPGAMLGGAGVFAESEGATLAISLVLMSLSTLLMHFVSCFSTALYVGFYYDVKARYEGSDIVSSIEKLRETASA